MSPRGKELAVAILQLCRDRPYRTLDRGQFLELQDITKEFGIDDKSDVELVINDYLIPKEYLRKVDETPSYSITQLGTTYLSKQGGGATITVGNNVNFAYNSPGAKQQIHLLELEVELQELVSQFDDAIKSKNKDKLKQVFGYIADKSVDVAIALATGSLLR